MCDYLSLIMVFSLMAADCSSCAMCAIRGRLQAKHEHSGEGSSASAQSSSLCSSNSSQEQPLLIDILTNTLHHPLFRLFLFESNLYKFVQNRLFLFISNKKIPNSNVALYSLFMVFHAWDVGFS